MLELRTEIEIDAPPERVWAVLIDFEKFPDWNPFIRRIHGNALVGSRLDVLLGASGTRPMRFRPPSRRSSRIASCDGWAASDSLGCSMASTSFKSILSGQRASDSFKGSGSAVCSFPC